VKTAPADPDAAAQAGLIEFKLLQVAYERLPLSLVLTAVVTAVFVFVMWDLAPPLLNMVWVGSITSSVLLRALLWWAWRRASPGQDELGPWRRAYLVGSTLAGLAWSSGPVLMVLNDGGQHTALLVATLLSVSAVALNSIGTQRVAMQSFIVCALAPFSVAVYFSASEVAGLLMMVLLAGLTCLLLVGGASNRSMRDLFETQASLGRTVDQARAARQRAETASLAKTRFLANMSHELRTPLNAVIGGAQLLRAEHVDSRQQAMVVDAIQRNGANLLGLIENVLDLARVEQGALRLKTDDFDLCDCMDGALATVAVAAQSKGLRLTAIVSPQLEARRHGDADHLRQVLMNLLGNAVKFTPQGEVVARAEPGRGAHDVRFSVTDTGVGIGDHELGLVFEPFRQADEGADRAFGGSGLGLAIAREVVQAMGGQLRLESRVGEGSCFSFELALPPATPSRVVEQAPPAWAQPVLFHEPHDPSAAALEAQLLRLGCLALRCRDIGALPRLLADLPEAPIGQRPWLLLAAEAPDLGAWQQAATAKVPSEQVLLMADKECLDAQQRPALRRPLTHAALVERFGLARTLDDEATAAPGVQGPQGVSAPHVLVVEDDETNRIIVCHLLVQAGCRVSAVSDGLQALQSMRQADDVALVLMDWQMPTMDGLEVTRRMRAGEAGAWGQRVPIVALTANAFAEDRERCLAAGMDGFLSKPVQAGSLFETVTRLARTDARRAQA
jgi:signal transduction histidine kinase/CheY-like chemotaxis protein